MKFEEFLNKIENDQFIDVKHYLLILEKRIAIDNIIDLCIDNIENEEIVDIDKLNKGVFVCNYINKEVFTFFTIFNKYIDCKIDEFYSEDGLVNTKFIFDFYDKMQELGFAESIKKEIGKDYQVFEDLLDLELSQKIKALNSIESILKTSIYDFKEKIFQTLDKLLENTSPKEVKKVLTQLSKLSPDKFPMLKNLKDFAENLSEKK